MLAADTSSAQALDTESDLFSPRSTAALALSSFAAQAVVEQQQLPPQHHRPAALFGNDAADDDDSGNSSNKPYVVPPSQAEQCQEQRETVVLPRKKPATVISSQEWEKKSAATKKSLASRSTNTAKAEMKKCGNNDRARSSISFPSSLPLQYPDQHHYQTHNYYMQHQQPQYGMVPIQFLPGYAVHHPDFYPPGATALPWTPHSCNDSLSSNNVVFPQRGPSPASSSITSSHGQSPSPPSPLVFHRDPAPSDNTIGGSSPTTIVSINHEPSKRISAVRMSGPSPRILHNRPSPPLHASPPTIGMMPHPHLHNHYNYHHFHRPHSVTWHYPPHQPTYFYEPHPPVPLAASPGAACYVTTPSPLPAVKKSGSGAKSPFSPPLEAGAETGGESPMFSSAVTPTSTDKEPKLATILVNCAAAQDVEQADAMICNDGSKKKKGELGYQRKKNSLGVLSESFVATYPSKPSGLTGEALVIDELASHLNVERRRIYDVVNILEALQLVVKRGKNTYHWMGNSHLSSQFAILQNEAIEMWPEAAINNGLVDKLPTAGVHRKAGNNEIKSLTKLSQLFVQVFLVGFDTINLPQASDIIQGYASTTEKLAELGCGRNQSVPHDPVQLQVAAARGLKTKIRRLYDIANVFLSVGLLIRVGRKEDNSHRRPHYRWNFRESAQQIRSQIWPTLTEEQKKTQIAFDDVQTTAMLGIGLNPRQSVQEQSHSCKGNRQSSPETDDTMKVKRPVDELSLPSHEVLAPKRRKHQNVVEQCRPPSPDKDCARRVSLPASGEEKHTV